MKILVPVKRVVDYNVKVRVNMEKNDIDLTNLKMAINPFCEIAIEEAVRLKEKGDATEVVVVSIGEKSCHEQLRTALALGADRAIHIETEMNIGSLQVAQLLQKIVDKELPDLVILGKQSIDTDNNQTGQMLAALLGWPQGTFASNLDVDSERAIVTREVDGGEQTLMLRLPAVITTDLRLNTPRYAKLPDIMRAKRKVLNVYSAKDFGVDLISKLRIIRVEKPKERSGGVLVSSVSALIEKLENEAKVI